VAAVSRRRFWAAVAVLVGLSLLSWAGLAALVWRL
jgi:hypothetical protein